MKVIVGTAKIALAFIGGAAACITTAYALIGIGMLANEFETNPEECRDSAAQKTINGLNYLLK